MAEPVDAVVVGAGLMGAASAWSLARRGRSVLLLEQFSARHRNGSSHGSARIVRRAYGDALYTSLTGQAFELWRELEISSDTQVLRLHGGLDFGRDRDVPLIAQHLASAGVEHEVLSAQAATDRWPTMRFAGPVLYSQQAGVLDPDLAVDAFVAQARRHGAEVRYEARVDRVRPAAGGVELDLADGTVVRAHQVVVAAGAWVVELLGALVDLPPLTVTEESVFHFPRLDASATPEPSTIHEDGPAVYHLDGGRDGGPNADRKIGVHRSGRVVSAATRTGAVDPALRRHLIEYVRAWLPALMPEPSSATTCLYTTTPSQDFVLDRVGSVVVCSPCSGHGAKFAPLVGEWVADLVSGTSAADLPQRFRLAAHRLAGGPTAVSL